MSPFAIRRPFSTVRPAVRGSTGRTVNAALPDSATPGTAAAVTPGLLHAPNRSTALRTVTISAMNINVAFSAALFAYFPITRGELVSHIWTKTVIGSCKDKSTWLHTSPWKASWTKNIEAVASKNVHTTPIELCRSRTS